MLQRVIAAILLLLLSIPIVLIWLLVLVSMGYPALFRQVRSGLHSQPFELVKFRTMRDTRDQHGALLPDRDRVTGVGSFLRRTRLDELPELWNILKGEMAFVGPRPLLPETIRDLGEAGKVRGCVKPGLTGWAQVNGNTLLSMDDKLALDTWYIRHASYRLDCEILARTLMVMLFGERLSETKRAGLRR